MKEEMREAIRAYSNLPRDKQRAVVLFLLDALEEERPGFLEEFPGLLDDLYGTSKSRGYEETPLREDYLALSLDGKRKLLDVAAFLRKREELFPLIQMARGACHVIPFMRRG